MTADDQPIPVTLTVRLTVNINDETAKTLRTVMAERNWSTTEAVRRAVAYLDLAERVRRSDRQFVVQDANERGGQS